MGEGVDEERGRKLVRKKGSNEVRKKEVRKDEWEEEA